MPMRTVGPVSVLDQTLADQAFQNVQPLLDDAEQQRQSIGTQPPRTTFLSQVPSPASLGIPDPTQVAAPAPALPSGGSYLDMIPGLGSLLGGQPEPTVPGIPAMGAYGVPSSMPQITAGGEAGDLEGWARSEARRLGIDPETAVRVANTEGGFGDPTRQNMEGAPAFGPYQLYIGGPGNPGLGDEALQRGIDPRNPAHARQAITYALEHAAKSGWGAFQGAAGAGIGNFEGIGQAVPQAQVPPEQTPAAQAQAPSAFSAGEYTPNQINAATAEGLDYETALAVCGPAAAIAFARKTGRNPTMQEAVGLARQAGWTVESGMAGPASQQRLLQSMGVAARLQDGVPDWKSVAADVQRGNPVIVSTPGHYFVAERFDPESGAFDFGNSAAVLKASGGRRWFKPEELSSLGMGEARASLFMDSPQSPSPSVVAGRTNAGAATPAVSPPPSGTSAGSLPLPADASPDPIEAARATSRATYGDGSGDIPKVVSNPSGIAPPSDAELPPRQMGNSAVENARAESWRRAYNLENMAVPGGSIEEGTEGSFSADPSLAYRQPLGQPSDDPGVDGTIPDEGAIASATGLRPMSPMRNDLIRDPERGEQFPGVEARHMGDEQPYDPDQGPRETGYTVNGMAPGGGGTPDAANAPSSPVAQPAPASTYGSGGDDPGTQATTPASPFKPLYDAAGAIVGYVQGKADEAYQALEPARRAAAELDGPPGYGQVQSAGPGEPDYVSQGGSVIRALREPIKPPERPAMPEPIDTRTATPEQRAEHDRQASLAGPQADAAAIPYQAAEAGRRSLMSAAESFANAIRRGEEGDTLAAAGSALWGLMQVVPEVAAFNTVGQLLDQMLPEANIMGVGPGIMVGMNDLVRLGASGINAVKRGSGALTADRLASAYDAPGNAIRGAGAAIDAGIETAGPTVRAGARAIGEGARGLAEEGARQLMDLTPSPGVVERGSGAIPPQRPTREIEQALREQVGPKYPDIRGRIDDGTAAQIGDDSAEMIRDSRMPRDVVHPDLRSETMPRVDDIPPRSISLNAGLGTVPESRRMYHGTAGAFERPDPGRFDENGLFGPGYYLTSDPRVASSYASEAGTPTLAASDLRKIKADLAGIQNSPWRNSRDPELRAEWQVAVDEKERLIAQLEEQLAGPTGANVRAVDVPKGIKLLEVEETMKPAEARRLAAKLAKTTGSQYFADLSRTSNSDMGYLSRSASGMMTEWRNTEPGFSWAKANQALAAAGYDGFQHTGGKRVPLLDDAGNAIEHDVTIIFPESLDKIRNGFSGEVGGATFGTTMPGSQSTDRLGAVNRVLSQGVASSVSGGVGAQVNQEMNPDDPYAGVKGFAVGAVGPALAARGVRAGLKMAGRAGNELRGGARIGLGDVPPSKVNQQGLPGVEHPPYTKPNLPDVSEVPNVERPTRGPERQVGIEGMGSDLMPPLERPARFVPEAERAILPNSLTTPREIVQNVIREEQAQARRLARQAASAKPDAAVTAGQTALPEVSQSRGILQRIGEAVAPWERRMDVLRYGSMLSDSATQVINAGGGVLMQGVDLATTPVAATIDAGRSAVTGRPRQVFFSELPARIAGMRGGASIGLQNAAEILRTGLSPGDAAKQLDRDAVGFASGSGKVDFAFEAPLRALAAADAVFRTMAQGGHLAAEGMAAAMKANPGVKITPDLLREAMKDPAVLERAQGLAARTVLQEERQVTKWYREAMVKAPPAVRIPLSVEIPFVKTPYNVIAQGAGLTPAGLLGVVQDMAEHKPARAIEYRVARVALGTAVMAAAAADYAAGNLTGPRPSDPAEASTLPPGWQPWSRKVKAGNETYYVPLAAAGPLAVPAVAAILLGESSKKGGDMTARAGRVALGIGQYAAQNTFFQGVTNIGRLVDQRDPDGKNLQRNWEQVAAQFSPHIVGGGALGREIQRVMGMPQRDPEGAIEALLATHPLTADRVEPRQDVLGRPLVPNASGAIAPFVRLGKERDAGVIRAFRQAKEGLPLAAPKTVKDPITDEPRTLNPKQQHRWRRAFGAALAEGWNTSGNPSDADSLREIESEARKMATDTVMGLR